LVGVDINSGKILYVGGSFPGSYHDMKIARLLDITNKISPLEIIMADKAYKGDDKIITPFKRPEVIIEEQELFNSFVNQVRVVVENTFARVKAWKCLSMDWRHDLDKHKYVFMFICGAVNLDINIHPIRRI